MGVYAPFVCAEQSYVGGSGLIGSQKDGCYFCLPGDLRGPPTTPATDDAMKLLLGTLLLHAVI